MAENIEGMDELMSKLQILIDQQAVFSREIETLKNEIHSINPSVSKKGLENKSVSPIINTEETEWPSQIDLLVIKGELEKFETGQTSSGVDFIKFEISRHNYTYYALCATNANWIVQDVNGNMIARGRFRNDGKMLMVTEGVNNNKQYSYKDITSNLAEAAGLNEEKEILPLNFSKVNKTIREPKKSSDIEKYIGENLIAVIAIVIILIGVVFGVKYSIDHNLISPLTRIILSYLLGIGILGVGMKLKAKYESFSAVLVSGAMGIMYFVTFAAYSFYGLFPQLASFILMVIFTAFTVVAAINYNKQIIAVIGLVGSYAVPFLLSNNSGNVEALFTYMTVINIGILVIALKRNWKTLYYLAFSATWLIYTAWMFTGYQEVLHFGTSLLFGTLFFLLFYATFLAYKLIEKEKISQEDIFMILANSTVYYGLSYFILNEHATGQHYLGLFTLATALIHFAVSVILFKSKQADRNLFYLSSGMVLVFITIAVPVQLDGSWVTLLWASEGALLFWIGRTKQVKIYEYLSYPIIVVAILSLFHDWLNYYNYYELVKMDTKPFVNITFLTSFIVSVSLGFILYLNRIKKHSEELIKMNPGIIKSLSTGLSIALILIVYTMFRLEMDVYWQQLYSASHIEFLNDSQDNLFRGMRKLYNMDIKRFQIIWTVNYSILFAGILLLLNIKKFKSKELGLAAVGIGAFVIASFLITSLYNFSLLRESYIAQAQAEYYTYSAFSIGLRYISYAFVAALLFLMHKEVLDENRNHKLKVFFELFMHGTILWILCSELINILDLSGSNEQHKLGLSILSGFYSFFLVGFGIWKQKPYLRIAAISLFGIVLLKLFFYDIVHLSTISKTIVFISLGILLLIISFMYNKYKTIINDQNP